MNVTDNLSKWIFCRRQSFQVIVNKGIPIWPWFREMKIYWKLRMVDISLISCFGILWNIWNSWGDLSITFKCLNLQEITQTIFYLQHLSPYVVWDAMESRMNKKINRKKKKNGSLISLSSTCLAFQQYSTALACHSNCIIFTAQQHVSILF